MKTALFAAAAFGLAALAGCATPGNRVSAALVDAGVPRGPADCFGRNLERTVRPDDLARIADAVDAARVGGRPLTMAEATRAAQASGDPLLLAAIVAAAGVCTV